MSKVAKTFFLLMVIVIAATAVLAGCGDNGQVQTSSSSLEKQTREAGGVTVSATPQNVGDGEPAWSFQLVFDTHTVELDQDPALVSVLVANGKEYAPIAWEGSEPGGHHREGILKFTAVSPRPQDIELIIREVGGSDQSFSWALD
ncbi:MAG: hypothetical protein HZB44_08580 [Actinobacteria bacterium]|nr:hypothetical protein [Actinomycetota bacterium]